MKAPWSGERVNPFIRVLAWVFSFCAVVALGGGIFAIFTEGFPRIDQVSSHLFGMICGIYLFPVFLRVAFTGHAPSSWIPWK